MSFLMNKMYSRIQLLLTTIAGALLLLVCAGLVAIAAPDAALADTGHQQQILKNGDFEDGMDPWWATDSIKHSITNGELCATILDPGENPWDAIIGQHLVSVLEGKTYTLRFDARSDDGFLLPVKCQQEGGDYQQYFNGEAQLSADMQTFEFSFTAPETNPEASFQFQVGTRGRASFCLDNIRLEGETPVADDTTEEALPAVHVNQTGYFPSAPKRASVTHPATSPLPWELRDSAEQVVASGETVVYGNDRASGDHVHIADFSAYTTAGSGYTLKVDQAVSAPFTIDRAIYAQLKYDALAYFYHNRSGFELTMPYAGGEQWTRPAGHLPDEATCFSGNDTRGGEWKGCEYTLDVTGGWYDAGDHGKYVVNGGISLWTMLNQYERTQYVEGALLSPFEDGGMNIPEQGNGVPDILDEARWEMEWMLTMQVPQGGLVEGKLLEGMVHHKVHDKKWTGMGTAPHEDPMSRFLYPPSTAATLNMAANAAQAARIWKDLDPEFSERCLAAAKIAFDAAVAHPNEYAENNFSGGGPYDDTRLSDEFYWAAAELFITTGDTVYHDSIEQSPHYLNISVQGGSSMYWGFTEALGTLSLLLAPNALAPEALETGRQNLFKAADQYVSMLNSEGYLLPFSAEKYPWGSNSSVLNNLLILASAYDVSGDAAYLNAVAEGMDYLMGRNPMDQSYVSGYGENPLKHPHHRFWSGQKQPGYPFAPPGAISGGPNSGLEDPFAKARLQGQPPQKCFVDDLDSWSSNEITINWNAPLAWVVGFLDEQFSSDTADSLNE